jgi:NAD-dependent dihydropyrimidine dehydrogenase PreA subunit
MAERSSLPVLDRTRCTDCGDCVRVCPHGVLALVIGRLGFVKPDSCDYCGECEAACGEDAISCPYDIVSDTEGHPFTDA